MVNKIYIICLAQNIERKKAIFFERLKCIEALNDVPVEIVEAANGSGIDKEFLAKAGFALYPNWAIDSPNPWWNRPMKVGEIGCAISHWLVWNKAKEEGHSRILVLEEDFLPKGTGHDTVTRTTEPWELFYLGRIPQTKDVRILSRELVMPGYSYQSHAYLVSATGLDKLLSCGFERAIIPIDEFLPALYCEHPREDIRGMYNTKIKTLALANDLIGQDTTQDSTTENTRQAANKNYQPLHPQLYDAFGDSVQSWVDRYVNLQLVEGEFDLICEEPIDNIYTFPVFTPVFCKELIEEAEHYGQWETNRHKKYPTTDMVLGSFGFDIIYNFVLKKYVMPLLMYKYTLEEYWMKAGTENFIARYSADTQQHLGVHHDGTHLSLILTLNTEFKGGGTYFPKFKKLIKPEAPGYMSVHPGMVGFLHGARPVTEGRRYIVASFIFEENKQK